MNIRWFERHDVAQVAAIERLSWPPHNQWDEEFLVKLSTQGMDAFSLVATDGNQGFETVAGMVVVSRHLTGLEIINLAVHPNYRRIGIGSMLLAHIKQVMPVKHELACVLSEELIGACCFLRANGLACYEIRKGMFMPFDGFVFRYVSMEDE